MLQRMRNLCLLMLPLLFLAGMLYLQGKSLPAAAPAVIPASADNWGLSFPNEGGSGPVQRLVPGGHVSEGDLPDL